MTAGNRHNAGFKGGAPPSFETAPAVRCHGFETAQSTPKTRHNDNASSCVHDFVDESLSLIAQFSLPTNIGL
jgi:hypothetical protein